MRVYVWKGTKIQQESMIGVPDRLKMMTMQVRSRYPLPQCTNDSAGREGGEGRGTKKSVGPSYERHSFFRGRQALAGVHLGPYEIYEWTTDFSIIPCAYCQW